MFFSKPAAIVFGVAWLVGVLVTMSRFSVEAQSQSQTVLTIVLRTSLGEPLEGVKTEVLSYDWGMPMGQAYGIIARGETDKNGVVAFDNTIWPFSGYRIKFTPTGHTRPARAYFLPDSDNQYRGYPGISTGGLNETQKFVLSGSDGLIYNDLSADGELPQYQRDPVGGMLNPRVSVMPGQDFVATVLAATATAEANGEPTPTFPPPPAASPRPDQVQPPLTITPVTGSVSTTLAAAAVTTETKATPPKTTGVVEAVPVTGAGSSAGKTAAPANQPAAHPAPAPQTGSGNNLVVSVLLAVLGITALVLFWKFRFRIYPLLGIETVQKERQRYFLVSKKRAKPRDNSKN